MKTPPTGDGATRSDSERRRRAPPTSQRPSEFVLRAALQADPTSEEALAALLSFYRDDILTGEPVSFTERFTGDPERAVVAGWRASGVGDWPAVGNLEPRLTTAGNRHPLYAEAIRLRAGWRIESGEPERARQAIELLEPLLSPFPRAPDLMLRARAANAGGDVELALPSGTGFSTACRANESPRRGFRIWRSGSDGRRPRSRATAGEAELASEVRPLLKTVAS